MSEVQTRVYSWLKSELGREVIPSKKPDLGPLTIKLQELLPFSLKKPPFKVITIAGTNGKGETALALDHLLTAQGLRTARWMSPAVFSVTERMSFQGQSITYPVLWEHLQQLAQNTNPQGWSYYEFLFLCFCQWVSTLNIDYLILEVGLGGRFDAVNTFNADLVLLPSISRDHCEILGKRYEQILREKLGVVRSATFLLCGLSLKYLRQKTIDILFAEHPQRKTEKTSFLSFPPESSFHQRNQMLAQEACSYLTGEKGSFAEFSPRVFKARAYGHQFTMYGSHNSDGLRHLLHNLSGDFDSVFFAFTRRDALLYKIVFSHLRRRGLSFYTGPFSSERSEGLAPEEVDALYQKIVPGGRKLFWVNHWEKCLAGREYGKNVLVLGSYYFICELQSYFAND